MENDKGCFYCGKDNPRGLKLDIEINGKEASAEYCFDTYMDGWKGYLHGGFISGFLDELMAQAVRTVAVTALTVEINVKFQKPVLTGRMHKITGRVDEVKRRIAYTSGSIINEDGVVCAEATAKFFIKELK